MSDQTNAHRRSGSALPHVYQNVEHFLDFHQPSKRIAVYLHHCMGQRLKNAVTSEPVEHTMLCWAEGGGRGQISHRRMEDGLEIVR